MLERREMRGVAILTAILTPVTFLVVPVFSNWLQEVTGSKADELAAKQTREAAIEAAAQTLRTDFEETGGVNFDRLADPTSYRITLRESAKLAPSTAEHWAQVIARVRRESGCLSIGPILHFPAEGEFLGMRTATSKPESWLITSNC